MFGQLALMVAAGLLGPLRAAGRRQLVPVVFGELLAGIVIGRTGFNLLDASAQPFPIFSALGLAMLMLSAGTDVDLNSPDLRRAVVRAGTALLLTLAASAPLGLLIAAGLRLEHPALLVVLMAGSSAAIAFPIIEERRLHGPVVALLIA